MYPTTTEILARFSSTARLKVSPTLAANWAANAALYGDIKIKNKISATKRAASALGTVQREFADNISPEQALAFKAAASSLRRLTSDLEPLVAWVKTFKTFSDNERAKAETAELEALAQARWQDSEAFAFEVALIQELGTSAGQRAFADWIHVTGKHKTVPVENIACPVAGLRAAERGDGNNSLCIAREIRDAKERDRYRSACGPIARWDGKLAVDCTFADYDAYLSFRKQVAATSKRLVEMASSD